MTLATSLASTRRPTAPSTGSFCNHPNIVKTIDYPATSLNTSPFGINKRRHSCADSDHQSLLRTFPVVLGVVNGKFSNMNPFDQKTQPLPAAVGNGIANSASSTGQVFQTDFNQAGSREERQRFLHGRSSEQQTGMTPSGTRVDSWEICGGLDASRGWFAKNIEAMRAPAMPTEVSLNFIVVKFPNSGSTVPFGLDNLRGVVGTYVDSTGRQHGIFRQSQKLLVFHSTKIIGQ